jgi:hypothetical protein
MDASIWCHCFKVICPDKLLNQVLGPLGRTKKEIQEETDSLIQFSPPSDLFPGTAFRVLSIHAKSVDVIGVVLQKIVERLAECGLQERPRLSLLDKEPEFCGKEEDDFLIRIAVCSRAATDIIGPKGSGIIAIREATGARVFVQRDCHAGHRLVKVVGTVDGIMGALDRLNDAVQALAFEPWYRGWAAFKKFSETFGDDSAWYSWWEGNESAADIKDGDSGRERTPRRQLPEDAAWTAGDDPGAESLAGNEEEKTAEQDIMLEALALALVQAQNGAKDQLEAPFTLTCDLTLKAAAGLRAALSEISKSTETRIRFEAVPEDVERRQCLVIEGAMLSTFTAHTLLMKRYHEYENSLDKVGMASSAAAGNARTLMKGKGLVKGKRSKGKGKGSW